GGFTMQIVEAAAQADHSISGSGILQLTVNGNPLEVPIDFTGVTVGDTDFHVCQPGSLAAISFGQLLGHTIEVTPVDSLPYKVIGLTLRPWFLGNDSRAWGEVVIDLPDTLRSVDQDGNRSGRLRL